MVGMQFGLGAVEWPREETSLFRPFILGSVIIGLWTVPLEAAERLNVVVGHNDHSLLIANSNSFEISDCEVHVNARYKTRVTKIAAGASREIALTEMNTSDWVPFNPQSERVQRIFMFCAFPAVAGAAFEP